MKKKYEITFKLVGTGYVEADSKDDAEAEFEEFVGDDMEASLEWVDKLEIVEIKELA